MTSRSSRVAGVHVDDFTAEPSVRTRQRARAIAANRPAVAEAMESVRAALATTGTLSPRLVELLRLRVAFHNQCRSCMALRYRPDEVGEDLVCSLERPHDAPDLTAGERVALEYADRFATDHLSIDDELHDRLRAQFDEGEIVELGTRCAVFVGFGRLAATWHLVEDLPASFREDTGGPITPWGHASVLALPAT